MLLVAQRGAEAHAYSHVVGDEHGHPGLTQGCDQCLSSALLLGAAPVPAEVLLARRWEIELLVPAAEFAIAAAPCSFAFQARGPPCFL